VALHSARWRRLSQPVVQLCAYARSAGESGVKFYLPLDRKTYMGPTLLDSWTLFGHRAAARQDSKTNLLLRLIAHRFANWMSTITAIPTDLFEEASDGETGVLAERLRKFADKHGSRTPHAVAQNVDCPFVGKTW